jgi:hypothetical protein
MQNISKHHQQTYNMPTIYYTSNSALQYNQTNNMADYYVDTITPPVAKFLTEAPNPRILAENELSALYFLCLPQNIIVRYSYYENNTFISYTDNPILEESLEYHNAITINWSGAPANANKMLVQIFNEDTDELTEIRYFIRAETTCIENQIVWLNKLGGYDSFMFTGGLQSSITASKETEIENPFNTNFLSPYAITSYRSINSNKEIKIAHRCVNNETAQWLKNELINSADIYFVENLVYKPVLVQDSNVGYNSYSKEFIVTFNLKFAFPINIQTK